MGQGPLAGRRVVELAGIGPGPFAAMTLADLGADVVRVDRPGGGFFPGLEDRDVLNRGKRSIVLDLREAAAVETVLSLVEQADVLIEGYRPGVAERLGVGPEQSLARNPKLIYGRMTGWGQDGPLASLAGHDITYIALTGALHAIGPAGGPPQIPLNLVGDFGGGGAYLVIGILAALDEARVSGRGQVVDAAIIDGTAHLLAATHAMLAFGDWADRRGMNLLDGGAPFYVIYETADGRHVAVGALENKFYAELLERLGIDDDPALQNDRSRWPQVRERLAAVFATRTQTEWSEVFAGSDACVAPVLSLREAAEHPQVRARGSLVVRDGVLQPAPAPRFSRTPSALTTPPPRPGQHNEEVLTAWGVDQGDSSARSGAAAELEAALTDLAGAAARDDLPAAAVRECAERLRELTWQLMADRQLARG